ncbi:MAG: ParB/RepB/Spo0J family partition protein [Thermoproteota archaeon]
MERARIPLDRMVPSPYSANVMTAVEFERLLKNVKERGEAAVEEVVVSPAPKELWGKEVVNPATGDRAFCDRGSYVVVSGWHRVKAARLAGLSSLEARVENLSMEEIRKWTFQYNVRGRNVGAAVFEQIKRMLEEGADAKTVAEIVGVSVHTVRAVGKAGKIHSSVREKIFHLPDPNLVTVEQCIDIASLETEECQSRLLDSIVAGTYSKAAFRTLLTYEETQKRLKNVSEATGKVVRENLSRGRIVRDTVISAVEKYPVWMREDLMERVWNAKDYSLTAALAEAAKEISEGREKLINSLPEQLKNAVERYRDFLNSKHILAIKSMPTIDAAIALLNEIIADKLTGNEALDRAREISAELVLEPKIFPLSPEEEEHTCVIECPHCKHDVEVRVKFNLKPSAHAEISVRESSGEYDVERRYTGDVREEVFSFNGIKFKVDYEKKTVSQIA